MTKNVTKLYTRIWKNTGMEGTPIFVFQTPDPNGTLWDAVGDICILSEDYSRKYVIRNHEKLELPEGLELDLSEITNDFSWERYGVSKDGLLRIFVNQVEEIYREGYADIIFGYATLEEMGFKLERYDNGCGKTVRAYREDIAKKMHIGENVIYCFNAESLVELMAEYPKYKCNFKLEAVIMEYPDGSLDEDMAYVVYHE